MLSELNKPARAIPRPVSTRWNSTGDLLDFSIEYKYAIEMLLKRHSTTLLAAYQLSDTDWHGMRQLRDLLIVSFTDHQDYSKHAFRSSRRRPYSSLAPIIRPLVLLFEHSITLASTSMPQKARQHRLQCVQQLLVAVPSSPSMRKWYSRKICTSLQQVSAFPADILHSISVMSQSSIQTQNWLSFKPGAEFMETNGSTTSLSGWRTCFLHGTLVVRSRQQVQPRARLGRSVNSVELRYISHHLQAFTQGLMMASPKKAPAGRSLNASISELHNYLSEAVTDDEDILDWWTRNRIRFPQLYLMARDYISIPGA